MISLRYSDPPQTDKEAEASKSSGQKPLDNFDITDYVSSVTWSGDEDQAARKLEFTIIYNTADKDTTFVQLDLKLGGYVYMFYRETATADEVELFQGRIFFRKRATDSYTFEFTAYDDMIYLAKSTIRAVVKGTAEDAIKNICAEIGIKTDVMPSLPTEVNFVADDKSATEVIQMILEQVRAATGEEYTMLALEGAVNVIKKGELVSYAASNQTNVTGAEHSESIEDMVDRVKSVDDNGTVCQMFSINDDIKRFGTIQKIYKMQPPKEGEAVDNVAGAKALLKQTKEESSLKAVGDINCIAGYALTVQEEQLKGKFHIKADSHSFNGNVHTMSLTLQYVPDSPATPEIEQVEYAKPVFNSSSKRMKKKRGTGGGDAAVDAGLNAGWGTWGGQTMANGRNGCAEFVGKCGSYYSPFLADECNNGVVSVPSMVQDADANGLLQGFDEGSLEKGDVIVYGDDDHVVIYDGQGGYSGAGGNVKQGTITQMPVTLYGVDAVTNVAAAHDGYEEENDDSLRERLFFIVRRPVTSGNANHYWTWATSVPGVGQCKVLPLWNGPGTVKVLIVDANNKIASSKLIKEVADYIEEVRPIGATVTVMSPEPVAVNVEADVEGTLNVEVFKTAMTKWLKAKTLTLKKISPAQIGKLILESGASDYDIETLKLNGSARALKLTDEQIATVGEVTTHVMAS